MSLADLTRNAFQSGLSSTKWINLCKLLIAKDNSADSSTETQANLSNSVLLLYPSYPGDPDLQEYIKAAIQHGILSIPVFVSTFLRAAQSLDLRNASTLDMLCRVALDAHYASGRPPFGSVIELGETSLNILTTIQEGLGLLRTAHSLPISPFHQLTTSASELLLLLLSCYSDLSQISHAQAMLYLADASDILQNFRLSADVRQGLEGFALTMSIHIGDDTRAARDAQMIHSIQATVGKGDILGATSSNDIVTCSLLLHYLMSDRATDFGMGNTSHVAGLLVATLRWTSWTPTVFYTQLIVTAFTALSQSSAASSLLWRSFVVSRLPQLLVLFESWDNNTESDWRGSLQTALGSLSRRSDLISLCDAAISRAEELSGQSLSVAPRSALRDFLHQLLANGIIEQRFAYLVDPSLANDPTVRLESEANELNLSLEAFINSKISPETTIEEAGLLFERVSRDPCCHASFAATVVKHLISLASTLDVEPLSHLCKILQLHDFILEILVLHTKTSDIIYHALSFLERYDCETVGDPQNAISQYGEVVLFMQCLVSRFHILLDTLTLDGRTVSGRYLQSVSDVHLATAMQSDEAQALSAWYKVLFDSNSDGIEDTILRATRPKTLLMISASLVSHATASCAEGKLEVDVLNGGVSYFNGALLNWTLVGVVKSLLKDIQHKGAPNATLQLETLQTLVLAPTCPRPVLMLCGGQIQALLTSAPGKAPITSASIDVAAIQTTVSTALGPKMAARSPGPAGAVFDQPRQAIRQALNLARTGHAPPSIDVERCIKIISPTQFLQTMWTELVAVTTVGELETCKRLATAILTTPREIRSCSPPLLPLFLHVVIPSLLTLIDAQEPPEQTMSAELLVTIISTVVTASLHVEVALRSTNVYGQGTNTMVRRLAGELRPWKSSYTRGVIVQRLHGSPSFVANFPIFASELGL